MDWELLKTVDDRATAEMLAELLNKNDVPSRIDYGSLESGIDGVQIFVAAQLIHRARSITSDPVSEEELTYLATGELPSDLSEKPHK